MARVQGGLKTVLNMSEKCPKHDMGEKEFSFIRNYFTRNQNFDNFDNFIVTYLDCLE